MDLRQEQVRLEDAVADRSPEMALGERAEEMLEALAPHFKAVRDAYKEQIIADLAKGDVAGHEAAKLGALDDVLRDVAGVIQTGSLAKAEVNQAQTKLEWIADRLRMRAF